MRKHTNYETFRSIVISGDIIFVGGGGWLSRIIRWVTRSSWNHVGIAFWSEDRLFIVEGYAPERRIVSLSAYSNSKLGRVAAPVTWGKIWDDALEKTGSMDYGYLDLFKIAVRERIGINLGDAKGEVCSEFVPKLLNANGFTPKLTSVQSPEHLRVELEQRGFPINDVLN